MGRAELGISANRAPLQHAGEGSPAVSVRWVAGPPVGTVPTWRDLLLKDVGCWESCSLQNVLCIQLGGQCPREVSVVEGSICSTMSYVKAPWTCHGKWCAPCRCFVPVVSAWCTSGGMCLTFSRCLQMLLLDTCVLPLQLVFCLFQGFTVLNYWILATTCLKMLIDI